MALMAWDTWPEFHCIFRHTNDEYLRHSPMSWVPLYFRSQQWVYPKLPRFFNYSRKVSNNLKSKSSITCKISSKSLPGCETNLHLTTKAIIPVPFPTRSTGVSWGQAATFWVNEDVTLFRQSERITVSNDVQIVMPSQSARTTKMRIIHAWRKQDEIQKSMKKLFYKP